MDRNFTTTNRGLAAVFMMYGHEPVGAVRNDRGKPALEFTKTPALMDIFDKWKDRNIVGNIVDFNDFVFKVNMRLKEVV